MPRRARVKSQTNIYHVMLRGINRQQIFFDKEDYRAFESILWHYKSICDYRLHAYCIMGNHIHLLIQTGEVPLGRIFKHIGSTFVYWYNCKYERVGHLFQDRYRSEVVLTDNSYLTVLRYILRNPVKAGLCKFPAEYPYSSGREYVFMKKRLTDTDFTFQLIDIEQLRKFLLEDNDDQCLDINESSKKRYSDSSAKELIFHEFGTFTPLVGKAKEPQRQLLNESIRKLVNAGVSIRQLSRLTGISKKMIETALKQ
jgi:REP element-mobilizing transposase RayT